MNRLKSFLNYVFKDTIFDFVCTDFTKPEITGESIRKFYTYIPIEKKRDFHISISKIEPKNPKTSDLWFDTSVVRGWSGINWCNRDAQGSVGRQGTTGIQGSVGRQGIFELSSEEYRKLREHNKVVYRRNTEV
jgi:hypothetical protein